MYVNVVREPCMHAVKESKKQVVEKKPPPPKSADSSSTTMKLMFERHHEGPVSIAECAPSGLYIMLHNNGAKVCTVRASSGAAGQTASAS